MATSLTTATVTRAASNGSSSARAQASEVGVGSFSSEAFDDANMAALIADRVIGKEKLRWTVDDTGASKEYSKWDQSSRMALDQRC